MHSRELPQRVEEGSASARRRHTASESNGAAAAPSSSEGPINADKRGSRGVGVTVHVNPPKRNRYTRGKPLLDTANFSLHMSEKKAEIQRRQRLGAQPSTATFLMDVPSMVAPRPSISYSSKATSNTPLSNDSIIAHPHSITVAPSLTDSFDVVHLPGSRIRAQRRLEDSHASMNLRGAGDTVPNGSQEGTAFDQSVGPTKAQLAAAAADALQQLRQLSYVDLATRQAAAERSWKQSHSCDAIVQDLHERLGVVKPSSQDTDRNKASLCKPTELVVDGNDKVIALQRAEMAEMVARLRRMLSGAHISGVPIIPTTSLRDSGDSCPSYQYCVKLSSETTIETYLIPILKAILSERVVVPMAGRRGCYSVPSSVMSDNAVTLDSFPTHSRGTQEQVSVARDDEEAERDSVASTLRFTAQRCFRAELIPFGLRMVSIHVSVHQHLWEHFFLAHARLQKHLLSLALNPPFPVDLAEWTDAHRQRLLYRVLDQLLHGGATPVVPATLETVAVFPAHVEAARTALWNSAFVGGHSLTECLTISEDAVAGYFGEEVMFYYAWMNHYGRWLLGAGMLSLLISLLSLLRVGSDAVVGAAVSETVLPMGKQRPTSSFFVSFQCMVQRCLDEMVMPLFSAALIIGGVVCVKAWERRCGELQMRYQLFQQEGKDEVRQEFRGAPGINPVTGESQLCYPAWYRAVVLQPLAWSIVALFMAGTLVLMVCSLNLDSMVSDSSSLLAIPALRRLTLDGRMLDKSAHPFLAMLPQLGYSWCIAGLSAAFTTVAKALTRMENYGYSGQYVRALMLKRVAFESVNSYAKLFFIAFSRGSMVDLSSHLHSIFYVPVISRFVWDTVFPSVFTHRHRFMRRLFQAIEGRSSSASSPPPSTVRPPRVSRVSPSSKERPAASHGDSQPFSLAEMDEMLGPHDIDQQFLDSIIQLGYILLFATAAPLTTLAALLCNHVQVRLILFKLCYIARRPVPRLGLRQNVMWCGIMRALALASVITNTFLLIFTSHQMERWFPNYFTRAGQSVEGRRVLFRDDRFVILLSMIMEHTMGLIAVFLFWRIPSTSREVRHYTMRKLHEHVSHSS